jgi:TonB family protein
MFEATLYTADIDRQRLQRLTLAAAIAIAATSTAIASMWTFDRLHIDRIPGPAQQFELAQLSLLPAPKLIDPPPPPKDTERNDGGAPHAASAIEREESEVLEELDADSDRPREIPPPASGSGPRTSGIPDFSGGIGCPGGVCTQQKGGTSLGCVGPHCVISDPAPPNDAPPTEVEFSALRCLACADPDRAALRKTSASKQGRDGSVVARFCVDVRGRVEAGSIEIERSYGDAAVDRITRDAIKTWRFSPMKVGNRPRRACSSAKFNIRFD